jgi:hypothetical protein
MRHFFHTFEQSLLRTSRFFLDKPSGGVLLQDRSKESAKKNGGPGMKLPFASVGYSVVKGNAGPKIEAYRIIGLGGEAQSIRERVHLERSGGVCDGEEEKLEEVFEKLSLFG